MSSNQVIEPIEHGGELDEAEEGDCQLLVAGGYTAVTFDASEEVFDRVPLGVETSIEAIGDTAAGLRREADQRSAFGKTQSEILRVKGAVSVGPLPYSLVSIGAHARKSCC